MNTFGTSLVTRSAGRSAFSQISQAFDSSSQDVVTFDFEGVNTITSSFADEVFGRLAYELGFNELRRRTTFTHISTFWATIVRSAIDARSLEKVAPLGRS
ncbi:STAS-like domain-containing protein [Atopobium sp. oral taxon 199]|uniref:STAS-like domain-containing protein n=1 Tax=Atopobium sp. oral taxon 199 TaxID=712156 RepID=UPI0018DE9600|nr:STAS-like domain-containing protein [Atopobium sp. oral taxon 199]